MYKYMVPDSPTVGRYRAILTTTDRERISGDTDVDESKRYESISRVRSRINELETDVAILEEHHPELLAELQEVVCNNE